MVIGVLALQGSFREHMRMLESLPGVKVIEVRKKEHLDAVAGLVIPGGESTTMALIAQEWGLLTDLQDFAKTDKPIWGTCAGLIFLAKRCTGLALSTVIITRLLMPVCLAIESHFCPMQPGRRPVVRH